MVWVLPVVRLTSLRLRSSHDDYPVFWWKKLPLVDEDFCLERCVHACMAVGEEPNEGEPLLHSVWSAE